MERKLIHNINFSSNENYFNDTICQGDSIKLTCEFFENGQIKDLAGESVQVNICKQDGSTATVAGTEYVSITGNKAVINLPARCISDVDGLTMAQIVIINTSTGKQIGNFPIKVRVRKSVLATEKAAANLCTMVEELAKANANADETSAKFKNSIDSAKENLKEIQETYVGATELSQTVERHSSQLEDNINQINSNISDILNLQNTSATKQALSLEESNRIKEIAVERERINNLVKLGEGSTTGDAELQDGRISMLGISHDNLGDAIRTQLKNVISSNTIEKTFSLSEENKTNGKMLEITNEFFKGQSIEITLTADDTVINKNNILHFGGVDLNGKQINDIGVCTINNAKTITLDYNLKSILLWIQGDAILNTGNVALKIKHSKNIYNSISDVNIKSENVGLDVLGDSLTEKNQFKTEKSFYITSSSDISVKHNCELEANQEFFVELKSNGILKSDSIIALGIGYESGEKTDIIDFNPDEEIKVVLENENATYIRLWCSRSNIISDGNVSSIISSYRKSGLKKYIENSFDKINDDVSKLKTDLTGKDMSIIGDSYSTYKGWIPNGYETWFSDEGNVEENNVNSVKDTWWWQLSKETGLSLLVNSSYSGSTICNTGYSGADSSTTSLSTRVKSDLGKERATQKKPNIIFVFGGTNDSWANSPIDSLKYNGWTEEDLKSVLPAFCYMIDYLKTWNPQARIINIINDVIKSEIKEGMINACKYYNVENISLNSITKENGHPNKTGMLEIKNQILEIL